MTFNDRDNVRIIGTVSRVNQKSVTATPDNRDGRWRVSAALLRHRVDIRRERRFGGDYFALVNS